MPRGVGHDCAPIRRARDLCGYTQEEAARRLGISRAMLSYVETGRRLLSTSLLYGMCQIYGVTAGYLLGLEDDPGPLQFAGRRGAPAGQETEEHRQLQVRMRQVVTNYLTLQGLVAAAQPQPVRERQAVTQGAAAPLSPHMAALRVRQGLRLGDVPVPDLFALLQSGLGFLVFRVPVRSPHFSAALARQGDVTVVVVNSLRTLGHQSFSAAHELGHACLEPDLGGTLCSVDLDAPRRPDVERRADRFAAAFLLPEPALLPRLPRTARGAMDLDGLPRLLPEFGVSWPALLYRLSSLRRLRPQERKSLAEWPIAQRLRDQGLPADMACVAPQADRPVPAQAYVALALQAHSRGEISRGRCIQYLQEAWAEEFAPA